MSDIVVRRRGSALAALDAAAQLALSSVMVAPTAILLALVVHVVFYRG